MRPLQLTLFLIANVIFITQLGRHAHLLVYGTEASVLERFEKGHVDKKRARSEQDVSALLKEYEENDQTLGRLEKDHKVGDLADLRQQNSATYERREALRIEISERERKERELRDMSLYCGYAIILYALGFILYRSGVVWPGFAILVTGIVILEYWASPTFFGGGGAGEYHQLLLLKIFTTSMAIVLLYLFWRISECRTKSLQ